MTKCRPSGVLNPPPICEVSHAEASRLPMRIEIVTPFLRQTITSRLAKPSPFAACDTTGNGAFQTQPWPGPFTTSFTDRLPLPLPLPPFSHPLPPYWPQGPWQGNALFVLR